MYAICSGRVCARTGCPKPQLTCASCVRHSLAGVVVVCASRAVVRCMYPCIPTHRLLYALPWRYTSFVSALTGDAGIRHPAHAYCLSPHPPGDAGIRWPVHAFAYTPSACTHAVSALYADSTTTTYDNTTARCALGLGDCWLVAPCWRLCCGCVSVPGHVSVPGRVRCASVAFSRCVCGSVSVSCGSVLRLRVSVRDPLCQRLCLSPAVSPSPALCLCLRPSPRRTPWRTPRWSTTRCCWRWCCSCWGCW